MIKSILLAAAAGLSLHEMDHRNQPVPEDVLEVPDEPVAVAPATPPAPTGYQYRLGVLRGGSLQPAGKLRGAPGVTPAVGLQPSAAEHGAGPAVSALSSEEEWRRMFPHKYNGK